MLTAFEKGKAYHFDIIEAINNSADGEAPGWLVKNLIQYDGQLVRVINESVANCDGVIIHPHWCKEVEL